MNEDSRNSGGDQWSPSCTTFSDPPHPADSGPWQYHTHSEAPRHAPCPLNHFHTVSSGSYHQTYQRDLGVQSTCTYPRVHSYLTMHETCHLVTCRATSARHTYDSCLQTDRQRVHRLDKSDLSHSDTALMYRNKNSQCRMHRLIHEG